MLMINQFFNSDFILLIIVSVFIIVFFYIFTSVIRKQNDKIISISNIKLHDLKRLEIRVLIKGKWSKLVNVEYNKDTRIAMIKLEDFDCMVLENLTDNNIYFEGKERRNISDTLIIIKDYIDKIHISYIDTDAVDSKVPKIERGDKKVKINLDLDPIFVFYDKRNGSKFRTKIKGDLQLFMI